MEDTRPDDSRPEGKGRRGGGSKKATKSTSRRNRSFLTRMGESFKRSGGERGADASTLRGTRGSEFEGTAQVIRGEAWGECGCCMDKDETEDKLLLIKGTYCFVFYDDEDKAPKYAISLEKMKPVVRGDSKNGRTVVTLEKNKEVEYEMSFEDAKIAKTFRDAVVKQAAVCKAEKSQGNATNTNKHSSVRYAEAVAKKKVKSQPEKETGLSSEDVMIAGS